MSEANVEIVRAAFEAWNRGDFDRLLSLWSEEAEFYPLRAQLEGRPITGTRGAAPVRGRNRRGVEGRALRDRRASRCG
jgi:ketosteroid isomerase-like protein